MDFDEQTAATGENQINNEVKDVQLGDFKLMARPKSGVNPKHDYWDQCVSCGEGFANLKKKPAPVCPQCMPDFIVTRQDDPADELREFLQEQEVRIKECIDYYSTVYKLEDGMEILVDGGGKLTFRVNQGGIASFTIRSKNKKSLGGVLHEIAADLEDWEGRVRQQFTDGGL
jgi:predicted  nucleic acid-binding Zn-ribbon protein